MHNIADRLEPFFDRMLIDELHGTTHVLHTPTPREVVLKLDRPWEGRYCGFPTVILDEGLYRLYYRGLPAVKAKNKGPGTWNEPGVETWQTEGRCCCAVSHDGIHFERPDLGLYDINGTTANNVCLIGQGAGEFAPFLDTNPSATAEARYKALGVGKFAQYWGLLAFCSPDGIHWTPMSREPVITGGKFDSQNVACWVAAEQCYACYFRPKPEAVEAHPHSVKNVRTIWRTTSTDFLNWTPLEPMRFGDTPAEHLYTSGTHPYFRAPHLLIALPKRYVPDVRVLSEQEADAFDVAPLHRDGLSEIAFMTSRGGNVYDRCFMQALVRPGLDRRNWVARNHGPTACVVPTGEAEMSLYALEHYAQPDMQMRRFSLRTDGFASVRGPYEGGEMHTRPFTFEGDSLTLNFSTGITGQIQVQIQDEQGRPLPGFTLEDAVPLKGDSIAQTVSWKAGPCVAQLAGRPIRLHFVMRDADLYALQFRKDA